MEEKENMNRFKSTKLAGIVGILSNVFLLIIKASIGFITNSQAMIADAFNSASDIFASIMTFIGNQIASHPTDEDHAYGHGKAEYIFSMIISISMMMIAFKLLVDSISSLINQNQIEFSWILILVCMVTIIMKLILFFYTNKLYIKYDNILLKANSKDHKNDCIITTFTFVSILFSLFHIYWIDGIVGTGISIWIFLTGIKIFLESYNVLMDISVDEKTKDLILNYAKQYKEIKKVSKIYSTPTGYQYFISLTIYIDGNMSTFESHKIADSLEHDIKQIEKIYDALIHVNPV